MKRYFEALREILRVGRDAEIRVAVKVEGRRRPPGERREHDSTVVVLGTEDGRFGVAHHPSPGDVSSLLGDSVRRRALVGTPGIRAACIDVLASDVRAPDPVEVRVAGWDDARESRAEMIADLVEDLGDGSDVLLVGHSSTVEEELRRRGFDVDVIDAHPRTPFPNRPRRRDHDVTVATGMTLSNGSIRTVLTSCSAPIILYSESCPNVTTCLVKVGAVDGAVVERFPFHFLPGGTRLESYTCTKG